MNKKYEDMHKRIDKITKNNNKKISNQDYKRARVQLKKIFSKT